MSDDDTIKPSLGVIKTGEFAKPNENRKALDELKRDFETTIELVQLSAKLRKATYDAYIDEGFSPEQAIYLLTNA